MVEGADAARVCDVSPELTPGRPLGRARAL